jgi:hypothetical protein
MQSNEREDVMDFKDCLIDEASWGKVRTFVVHQFNLAMNRNLSEKECLTGIDKMMQVKKALNVDYTSAPDAVDKFMNGSLLNNELPMKLAYEITEMIDALPWVYAPDSD